MVCWCTLPAFNKMLDKQRINLPIYGLELKRNITPWLSTYRWHQLSQGDSITADISGSNTPNCINSQFQTNNIKINHFEIMDYCNELLVISRFNNNKNWTDNFQILGDNYWNSYLFRRFAWVAGGWFCLNGCLCVQNQYLLQSLLQSQHKFVATNEWFSLQNVF